MSIPIRRTIPLALTALFGAMLLTLAMLAVTAGWFARETALVERAEAVEGALSGVRASFRGAESEARGYLVSGNASMPGLSAAEAARARAGVEEVARLTVGNAAQEADVPALRAGLARKLSIVDALLADRSGASGRGPSDVSEGERTTATLDAVIDRMQRREQVLLAARTAGAAASGRRMIFIGAILAVLFAAGSWLFGRSLSQAFEDRERAYAGLVAADEERKALVARLQRSNSELQEFAMVASHDLQEPLRKVQMFGERLDQEFGASLGPTGRDYLRRMTLAGARGQSLVLGLLAYSRITTKARPFVRVDLGKVAREVASDLEAHLESVHGQIEIGSLPTIEADPLQMRQLVQNLVGNGLKFHKPSEPPVVRIRATCTESEEGSACCSLVFEDNGIGFDEKYADRIFKLFQRLHERGVYEGSGMGLAICRKIVERHGGSITVHSTPGVGSQFVVELPGRHGSTAEAA